MTRTPMLAALLTAALVTPIPAFAAPASGASAPIGTGLGKRADFNGDGFSDLAVGVPDEKVGTKAHAGAVNVLYGGPIGISISGDQIFTQDTPGVAGIPQEFDLFGSALAVGDFDGDGYADLAIGIPGEDLGLLEGKINAGGVQVLYGDHGGLNTTGAQFWSQGDLGIQDAPEDGDLAGSALTAGDFDGDGYSDLAIGVPGEKVGSAAAAGAVTVIYGGSNGLASSGNQFWAEDTTAISGTSEENDRFGSALAAGDFDGNGRDDLAIGSPLENLANETPRDAGSVHVIYGATAGLTAANNQLWSQGTGGVQGVANNDDKFGTALAAGDFDGDEIADLAVGVPGEDIRGLNFIGGVNVLYGTQGGGLSATNNQLFTEDTPDVPGEPATDDKMGTSLAAGDFDGDGFAELAVGIPGKDVNPTSQFRKLNAGALVVLPGTATGLTAAGSALIASDVAGEELGAALLTGDFDGDGTWDLAAGLPNRSVGVPTRAGAVKVMLGSSAGLDATTTKLFTQDTPGIEGAAEQFDHFGTALG